MYPNDGTFLGGVPTEPVEQTVARKKEKAQTLQVLPILKEIIEQLETDIAFYGSVDSIPANVKSKPREFLIVHNANELTRNVLQSKKEWIESLMDTNAPNR